MTKKQFISLLTFSTLILGTSYVQAADINPIDSSVPANPIQPQTPSTPAATPIEPTVPNPPSNPATPVAPNQETTDPITPPTDPIDPALPVEPVTPNPTDEDLLVPETPTAPSQSTIPNEAEQPVINREEADSNSDTIRQAEDSTTEGSKSPFPSQPEFALPAPVVTASGQTVVAVEDGQPIIQSQDGSQQQVSPGEIGAKAQEDGSLTVQTLKGETVTLPSTGENSSIFTLVGTVLAGLSVIIVKTRWKK